LKFWINALTIRIDHEKKELSISVRDLAFYGSPKTGTTTFPFKNAEKGREIHQTIQNEKKTQSPNYKTEFYLKYLFDHHTWKIKLKGRIDLLAEMQESIQIEEIKSFYIKNYDGSLEDTRIYSYVKQLQCYAWMYTQIEKPQLPLKLVLILHNRFDSSQYQLSIPYIEMGEFITDKLDTLLKHEGDRFNRYQSQVGTLENLHFPFSFRKYQEKIIDTINQALDEDLNLMIEAPSGLGKTVVSLYPFLSRSIQENMKLFFLTAKATQRRIVEKTLKIFHSQGVDFLAVTLKAKEKMCSNLVYFCHEDYCPYLKNYLHNYPESYLKDFISKRGIVTPEVIEEVAIETQAFCPFEFALDLSLESTVIIGDYNYVFHPRVVLQRFFGSQVPSTQKYYLIIDEAHNLVDRSLDYYSHNLSQKDVFEFKQELKSLKRKYQGIPIPDFLPSVLERIFRILRTNYGITPSTHLLESLDVPSFETLLLRLEGHIVHYLRYLFEHDLRWPQDPVLWFYYHLRDFTETAKLAQHSEEFSIIYNSHNQEIKLLCKDASPFLRVKFNFFKSVIAISATITPFFFYRDLLGFPVEKTAHQSYPSPFPSKNRIIRIYPDVDTRYNQRHESYANIGNLISKTIQLQPGKYFAFFPSFKYASEVLKYIKPTPEVTILKQLGPMHDDERKKFVEDLESNSFVLAIAVTAGIFAEGLDFPGMLNGVFIISPSLPSVSFERELIRQYYEERYSNGFAYAYQFPGLTRSFQAAGRLIRTVEDKGIIIFIGRRYATPTYGGFFPTYYFNQSPRELVSSEILNDVKKFWQENQSK
jgi:DNA excision repair protein ERCC-2